VTRGLLTTRATSIERRRLVGATISEPLPLRMVGAARTGAVATGLRVGRGAERGGEVLLPPAPRREAEGVAAAVLDGTSAVTAALRPHGPGARRRRLARAVVTGAVVAAAAVIAWAAGAPFWPVTVGALLLLLGVPLGLDRAAALGHARVDGYLVTRSGSLLRRRSVLEERAIIGWNIRSTFFQRRLGLVTLVATTAAGQQGYPVLDIATDDGLEVAEGITPDLIDQFRRAPLATSR
jgi:putative membrane protein